MNETLKYKILTFVRYFADAMFYPFFSLYLQSLGLVEERIGFILSITPLTSIFASIVFSKFCKNLKIIRSTLFVITIFEAIFITLISFSSNFYLVSILTFFIALSGSTHYSLLDSLSVNYCNQKNIQFSKVRMFGSLSYVISTTLSGFIIDNLGYRFSFIGCSVLFIISSLLYVSLKPIEEEKPNNYANSKSDVGFISLIKNKDYLLYLLTYIVLFSSILSCDSFLSLFLKTKGVSNSQYGFIYSYYVIVEVIVMLIFSKCIKSLSFNPSKLLILCSLSIVIRMCSYYFSDNLVVIIILTGLKGFVNAVVFSFFFQFLINIVGKSASTLAILVINTCHNIILFILNNVLGNVISSLGYSYLYLIAIILSLVGLALTVLNHYNLRRCK